MSNATLDAGRSAPPLERELECAAIEQVIASAIRGTGRFLVVEGPAGIGKTLLLVIAQERATASGLVVLQACGGERERDFGFGVTRQLLEREVSARTDRERQELLSGAARLAAPALGLATPGHPVDAGSPPEATLHGLYWLCAKLADERAALLVVDDLHWADGPSQRFLLHLVRRLDGLSILVVAAARSGERGVDRGLTADILRQADVVRLTPAPLSRAAVAAIIAQSLGHPPAAAFADACHRASGGNPMLVHALVGELALRGISPGRGEAARVPTIGPTSVAQSVLARLDRLPGNAQAVARAVAVLGDAAELRRVAALAGVTAAAAAAAADALAIAAILERERPLRFVHPIVRTAIHDAMLPGERTRWHARAARLLDREQAEPGRIASHLLATEPAGDPWTVARLDEAAERALAEGAPDSARPLLARALEEPPPEQRRRAILLRLGHVELQLGDARAAAAHLQTARALSNGPQQRAEAGMAYARALIAQLRLDEAVATLEAAEAEVEGVDEPLRRRIAGERLSTLTFWRPSSTRAWTAELRARIAEGCVEARPLLALLAHVLVFAGENEQAAAAAERALDDGRLLTELGLSSGYAMSAIYSLVFLERYASARRAVDAAIGRARQRGEILDFAAGCLARSHLMYRCGDLREADADARLAQDLLEDQAGHLLSPVAAAFLVDVLVETDSLAEAATIVDSSPARRLPQVSPSLAVLQSRARLRNAQRQHGAALEDAFELGRRLRAWECASPAPTAWRDSAVVSLLALGRNDEARRLAAEEATITRKLGLARPLGIALRVEGIATGGERGIELLREAVTVLERSEARLEHARALTDLGAALRRRNRRAAAREPLRRGLDRARACGASLLVKRAYTELWATGARPRTPVRTGVDALTPSELRVAEMAASGMSNPALAQSLFVTVKTVENHLSHAYRKLGIDSRAKLSAALATRDTSHRPD